MSHLNPAISTANLTKKFGRTEVLKGIDLAVPEGAIYALVGANGAGKTTLIKLLMNILRPTSGSAHVLGLDASQIAGSAFTCIGYVSENQDQPEWMTVGAMLDYMRPFYPQWDPPSPNISWSTALRPPSPTPTSNSQPTWFRQATKETLHKFCDFAVMD